MILPDKPSVVFRCKDGTVSTHDRRGACNWHGGLKTGRPLRLGARGNANTDLLQMVPLREVNVRHEWFQNRDTPYSLRSVHNIITAVQQSKFRWGNFDAITLWENPGDKKLYVLSGHSRHEAFVQLCAAGMTAEGRGFCDIPAKIVDVDLETAKKMALESNALSTKETVLERATFYRRQREGGADAGAVKEVAKRLEGRNANAVLAYSYLNPNGKTWRSLQALANGQADSRNILLSVGHWIGLARSRYDQLTNSHEDELYTWLITAGGYGRSRGQVNTQRKFLERLDSLVNRRTQFGKLDERLNIADNIQRSPVEVQYNAQLEEAKRVEREREKELKEAIRRLTAKKAADIDIIRITRPLENALRLARQEKQRLILKGNEVREAARNQQSLFAGVSGTSSSGLFLPAAIAAGIYLIFNR